MATEKEEAAAAREAARRKLGGSLGKGRAGPPVAAKTGPLPHPRSDPGPAAARAARSAAAAKLRGSMGRGSGQAPSGGAVVSPAQAAGRAAAPLVRPAAANAVGAALAANARAAATPARNVAASTPRAKSGRPRAKGSIGAASNRDLPGRTTIKYAEAPKRDAAALRAGSKARFEAQKAIGASRLGAAARSRAMNRNK